MDELFICDECGRPGRRAPETGWCVRCENEYQQGIADADRYRTALAVGGEAAAIELEIADEMRGQD